MMTQNLICHGEHGTPAVRSLSAVVELDTGGALRLTYTLRGDIGQILIPPIAPARKTDGLWMHTCFEVFIQIEGQKAYREYNFSPSGEWAAYGFDAYRRRNRWACTGVPAISVMKNPLELVLEASISPEDLPVNEHGKTYRLGLSAVIEDRTGHLTYWALSHGSERPDFHLDSGFICSVSRKMFFR